MTAPRDGDRVRVVVEGIYIGSPSVGGGMRGYVRPSSDVEVFFTESAVATLHFEVLTPAGWPGRPGDVWEDDADRAYWVTRDPAGVVSLVSASGVVWDPGDLVSEVSGLHRLQVGDPS